MISEVTRLAIHDEVLAGISWFGRLDEIEFLARLYPLSELPSTDTRFPDAASDIYQHRVNNDDWPDDWFLTDPRFGIGDDDDEYLRFLSETVHPAVRPNPDEAVAIVAEYNRLLAPDGHEIAEVEQISGRPIYSGQIRPPGPLIRASRDQDGPADTYSDLWLPGHVRVFLSHIAEEHSFVSQVNQELHQIEIDGFVAHSSIEPDREWQHEIERALRSCDVLVGLLHRGFSSRHWTQQEVGWALGREIPVLMIRIDEDPVGFKAKQQARTPADSSPWATASAIAVLLSNSSMIGPQIVRNLVQSLESASSYVDGRHAAERLEQVGRLSEPVLDAIEHVYLSNDELYPHHVGAIVIERILKRHHRELPTR